MPNIKPRIFAVAALFLVALSLFGQGSRPSAFVSSWQIKPQLLTTTMTDIATLPGGPPRGADIYVCWLDIADKSASATPTVTIQDGQGTPVAFLPAATMQPNSAWILINAGVKDDACRWFPGGMSWSASANNTVTGYVTGKW